MDTKHFKSKIAPFFWVNHEDQFSVCLVQENTNKNFFETREEEGFEGNGYDWCALAKAFLKEYMPELKATIHHDPEARHVLCYATDADALRDSY